MRPASLLLALLLLAATGCGKWFPPAKWEESIARATDAWTKRDFKAAADLCERSLGQATTARDGAKAMQSLECFTEAAWLEGKPARALNALAQVLGDFPDDFRAWNGRHRLRNNHAMALLEAGRKPDAIATLEAALDAYEDTAYHSSHDYRARMVIATNLGRLALAEPEGPLGLRMSVQMLAELRERMTRYGNAPNMLQGVGEALEPIAQIVRARGDPGEADELLATAKERREADEEDLGAQRRICNKFTIRLLAFEPCMRLAKGTADPS